MCYQIFGLENPAINFSITGTGHFMKNIIPDMYTISVVDITGQELTMGFRPTPNVPNEYISDSCSCCTLRVHVHNNLRLIVKEIHGLSIRYLFVSAKDDHFQYVLLKKNIESEDDSELMHIIKPDLCASDLEMNGFTVAESGENGIMPVFFTFS